MVVHIHLAEEVVRRPVADRILVVVQAFRSLEEQNLVDHRSPLDLVADAQGDLMAVQRAVCLG